MSKKAKPQPNGVDTGGGAYVGGNVTAGGDFVGRDKVVVTGDGNVVGDHSSATVIKQANQGATLDEFRALLAELRQELAQAGLDADTAEVVDADVRTVEEQAAKPQPKGAIILSKLKGVAEVIGGATGVLTATGGAASAAQKLLPLAQKAVEAARLLFH
jgi:hypothetical protein